MNPPSSAHSRESPDPVRLETRNVEEKKKGVKPIYPSSRILHRFFSPVIHNGLPHQIHKVTEYIPQFFQPSLRILSGIEVTQDEQTRQEPKSEAEANLFLQMLFFFHRAHKNEYVSSIIFLRITYAKGRRIISFIGRSTRPSPGKSNFR
jgi:hypothetical protein